MGVRIQQQIKSKNTTSQITIFFHKILHCIFINFNMYMMYK